MTHRDRPGDRNGGFPRLSDGVARALRCPASPRHALLAENLGTPSLWVIISAPWYKPVIGSSNPGFPAARFGVWAPLVLSYFSLPRQSESRTRPVAPSISRLRIPSLSSVSDPVRIATMNSIEVVPTSPKLV